MGLLGRLRVRGDAGEVGTWKLGQLRPDNRIRFKRLTPDDALAAELAQERTLETLAVPRREKTSSGPPEPASRNGPDSPVLATVPARGA